MLRSDTELDWLERDDESRGPEKRVGDTGERSSPRCVGETLAGGQG